MSFIQSNMSATPRQKNEGSGSPPILQSLLAETLALGKIAVRAVHITLGFPIEIWPDLHPMTRFRG
jgi:hypothetical protein